MAETRNEQKAGKLKLGLYWAASCGGCEIAIVELREKILDLDAAADILFWPVALDFKYKDVEAMPDGQIDVCLFNGAIRNTENEHLAHLLRQ
ncbi:MAG: oxidoreductase, partial [Anaerolineae bacterium]